MSADFEDERPSEADNTFQNNEELEAGPDTEYSISTPYSIVWTPLPVLTWILPFIGHTGITE
jgi:hypothetical protein